MIGFLRSTGAQVPSTDIKKVNHESTRRKHALFLKIESLKAKTFLCVAYNSKDIKGKWSKFIT